MAGNFWQSSHSQQWILDRQDLIRERQHDLQILSEEEYQKIFIFFANVIQVLGEQLKLRQQVIATATVYFKRFYARNSLKNIDPLLLAPTCILLASKVEEFGVISNSRLISICQSVIKSKFGYAYTQDFPYRTNHILECEFYLLENLDCCLIVYQPYRPLLQLVQDIGQEDQLLTLSWRIVNDSLRTDICLLYPPYQVNLFYFKNSLFLITIKELGVVFSLSLSLSPIDCHRLSTNRLCHPTERCHETMVCRTQCRSGQSSRDCTSHRQSLRIMERLEREG